MKSLYLTLLLVGCTLTSFAFDIEYRQLGTMYPTKGLFMQKTTNGYITGGTTMNREEVFLKEVNHNGVVQWAYEYDLLGDSARAFDITKKPDGTGYVVCGYVMIQNYLVNTDWRAFVMEVNLSGVPVQAHYYEMFQGPALHIEPTYNNNQYIIAGFSSTTTSINTNFRQAYVAKINLNGGTMVWNRFFEGNVFSGTYRDYDMAESIEVIQNASINGGYGYFISGSFTASQPAGPPTFSAPTQKVMAVLLDDFGNVVWDNSFNSMAPHLREIGVDAEYDSYSHYIYLISNNDNLAHGFTVSVYNLLGALLSRTSIDINYTATHAAHFPASNLVLEDSVLKVFGYGLLAYVENGNTTMNPYFPYQMHLELAAPHNQLKYTVYETNNAGATMPYNGLLEIYPSMGYIAPTIYTPEMGLASSGVGSPSDYCMVTLSQQLQPVLISNDPNGPCDTGNVDSTYRYTESDTLHLLWNDTLRKEPGTPFTPGDSLLSFLDSAYCCPCDTVDSTWVTIHPTSLEWAVIHWDSSCADSFYVEIFDFFKTKVDSGITTGKSFGVRQSILPVGDQFYYRIWSFCDGDTLYSDTMHFPALGPKKEWNLGFDSKTADLARVYPNPFTAHLSLQLQTTQNGAIVIVQDMLGREVYTSTFSGKSTSLDLTALEPGNYLLRVEGTRLTEVITIVKLH